MAAGQSRCGGTNSGASQATESSFSTQQLYPQELASDRTLRRKRQSQHTRQCWQRALAFAVAVKPAIHKSLSTAVCANDLEEFRHLLYAGRAADSSIGTGSTAWESASYEAWGHQVHGHQWHAADASPWSCPSGGGIEAHHTVKSDVYVGEQAFQVMPSKTQAEECKDELVKSDVYVGEQADEVMPSKTQAEGEGKDELDPGKEEDDSCKASFESHDGGGEESFNENLYKVAQSGIDLCLLPEGCNQAQSQNWAAEHAKQVELPLKLNTSVPLVQQQDVMALCAVRRLHRATFKAALVQMLHNKLKAGRSHGTSLSPQESRLTILIRRLAQASGCESPFVKDEEPVQEVRSEGAFSRTLPMCNVAMQAPKIKSGLPQSLQKLEEARAADLHDGASCFRSLLAGRA